MNSQDPDVTTKKRYNRKQALASEPSWSDYQLAIFNELQGGEGHLQIGAVAGSGKTTTITGIVNRCPVGSKVAVLAFNVHIVETLKERLPKSVTVATAHGMGRSMLIRYFSGRIFEIDELKYRRLAKEAIEHLVQQRVRYEALRREYYEGLKRQYPLIPTDSAEKVKYEHLLLDIDEKLELAYSVVPPDIAGESKECKSLKRSLIGYLCQVVKYTQVTLTPFDGGESSLEQIAEVIAHFDVEEPEQYVTESILPLVPQVLQQGEKLAAESFILDLNDLIWLPNVWSIKPAQKDFVIVDECQDANLAMMGLYKSLVQDGGRLIVLGDERQAIMGFAGSDAHSWQRIKETLNPTELPLSVCYRCPESHVDLARKIVPQIEARPDAPMGDVIVIPQENVKKLVTPGCLIICRFTYPVVKLCLELIVDGFKARVRGRDIGKALAELALKAAAESLYPHAFMSALFNYCQPRIDDFEAEEQEKAAQSLRDRKQAIEACFKAFGSDYKNIRDFCAHIESLFIDDGEIAPIILSTIHRSKGDEADTVFLLGSNSLPYLSRADQHWQQVQEWNLLYVALTRSRDSLYLVPLPVKSDESIAAHLKNPLGGMKLTELVTADKVKDAPPTQAPTNTDDWLSPENLLDMKETLAVCDFELLAEARKVWPAHALSAACKLLPLEKRREIKGWVLEQNNQLNQVTS